MEIEKLISNDDEWDWRYAGVIQWSEWKDRLVTIEGFHLATGILIDIYEDDKFYHVMGKIKMAKMGLVDLYLGGTKSLTIYPEEERILWLLQNT